MSGEEEPTFEELRNKYAEISRMIRQLTGHDPRSHDLAQTRLEESLMWSAKGVQTNGNNNER